MIKVDVVVMAAFFLLQINGHRVTSVRLQKRNIETDVQKLSPVVQITPASKNR